EIASAPRSVLMWKISAIAERDGISKQAVSKHVKRLIDHHSLTVERSGSGKIAAVNVAEYDHLREKVGDPSKAQAPPRSSQPIAPNETYDEALRQKTWIETERACLLLAEAKGQLVRLDRMKEALARCGAEIAATIDRLPNASDDI